MFLTKEGFRKILIISICYFVLGSLCVLFAFYFNSMGVDADFLMVLAVVVYLLCVIVTFWGYYAEGKFKLINLGNKLVRNELRPAEFIKAYEHVKNSDNLIVRKPAFEVLQLVALAYDTLHDQEKTLATLEEMIAVAGEKKKAYINLLKASILFSYHQIEEAETLFRQIQKCKLDFMCNAMVDGILKGERAIAMGDYAVAEVHGLKMLQQTFPKPDNLSKLVIHEGLGEIYEKMQDTQKAVSYYRYCVNHGGETAIKQSAKSAIERLSKNDV